MFRSDTKLIGILKDEFQRRRQIFNGILSAAGAIFQHKGVVTFPADLGRVWKSFVKRTDVGESAARIHHRERRPRLSPVEKESRIAFCRNRRLFLFRVDVVKDRLSGIGVADQAVERSGGFRRFHIAVIRQKRRNLIQRNVIIPVVVPRQQTPPEIPESRVIHNILNGIRGPDL